MIYKFKKSIIVSDSISQLIIPDYEHVIISEFNNSQNISIEIKVGKHALVEYTLQEVDQKVINRVITFVLEGEYGQAYCFGKMTFNQNQSYQLVINQFHKAAYTKSSSVIKMVLKDQSKATYKGTILIAKEGIKSNALQSHKALILSNQAVAISEPQLEILTDDVMCSHGSAISYIDQSQMYYLMSRGITQKKAEKIIVQAFLVY